jgi:ribonuclease J
MLFRQKEFIKNHVAGYDDNDIILIENGELLEIDEYGARVVEKHDLHKTFIDEESSDEIEYDVIRERKKLAYGGMISLVVTVDKTRHTLVGEPQITLTGVAGSADYLVRMSAKHSDKRNGEVTLSDVFAGGTGDADRSVRAPNGFSALARAAVAEAVAEMKPEQIADRTVFKENLRIHLKRFVQKELSSKPVILTTIVEV